MSAPNGRRGPRRRRRRRKGEEEEGSRWGSLVEGDPATENWTGEKRAIWTLPAGSRRHQKLRAGVPGGGFLSSAAAHHGRSRAPLWMHLKPNQCISCGLFSHVWRHPGHGHPGVVPCHGVLLLKARKVYFSVTQRRHPQKRGRTKNSTTQHKKQRHKRSLPLNLKAEA